MHMRSYLYNYLYIHTDLVVGFPSSLDVKADENSGIAQPTLVFNRPSAFIETVQLEITELRFAEDLATGMANIK